jgi:hypothetical protein
MIRFTCSIALFLFSVLNGAELIDIHEAAYKGDLTSIKKHIATGSNLNHRADSGATPMITAATFGRTDVVEALVKAGAGIDLKDNDGSTALHCAAFFCHPDMVRILLANGADKNLRNKAGATPLDSVQGSFGEVRPIYQFIEKALAILEFRLDYERLEKTRPRVAKMLR